LRRILANLLMRTAHKIAPGLWDVDIAELMADIAEEDS